MAKDDEKIEQGKILCRFIIEMLGAPKEHIEKTMKGYVAKLKEDKELEIIKEDYADVKPQDKMFSTFVELEVWVKDIYKVVEFCFDALPSSVEIIEPESIKLESRELAGLLNDLQAKLHKMDLAIKSLKGTNIILDKNANNLLRNIILLSLKENTKKITEISKDVGIIDKHLQPFIDKMVEEGNLKKEGDKYRRIKRS
jgi:hypothetical protein